MSMQTRATRRLGAAALVISLTACGEHLTSPAPPSSPSSQPPTPPTAGVTVSGIAIEFTASGVRRPVPNLRLKVWKPGPRDGAVGGVELPDTVTDADGRYTITDVPTRELWLQTAPGSEYRFLCDFHPVLVRSAVGGPGFSLSDLPVVHAAWSGTRLPPGMWTTGTSVYGTVSERVNGSLQPVAGATVSLDGGLGDAPATTSPTGFYMVCSTVGTDVLRDITAQKTGYVPVTRQIFGGWDFEANLELARR